MSSRRRIVSSRPRQPGEVRSTGGERASRTKVRIANASRPEEYRTLPLVLRHWYARQRRTTLVWVAFAVCEDKSGAGLWWTAAGTFEGAARIAQAKTRCTHPVSEARRGSR